MTITVILLFSIEMILKIFIGLLNGTFQAFEEGKCQGIGNTLLNTILIIFILISIFTDLCIYSIAISYIVSNFIALIFLYYVFRKKIVKPKFELDKSFCKKLHYYLFLLLQHGYWPQFINVVMLTNLVGYYATGIYNETYKLVSVFTLFHSVYITVIFPVMSKFYKDDKKLVLITFEKSIKYLILFIIPFTVTTIFYSLDVIQLIYGHEYDATSSVLYILIWVVYLLFISCSNNALLNSSYIELFEQIFILLKNYLM